MTPCVSLKCVSNYDGVWFRAVVLEIFPEERQALVQYIDYGNQETLAFNKFPIIIQNTFTFGLSLELRFRAAT